MGGLHCLEASVSMSRLPQAIVNDGFVFAVDVIWAGLVNILRAGIQAWALW